MDELKREALLGIARTLNAERVEWAVGGSLMLYLRGIANDFNDIDLVLSTADAPRAIACLDALATRVGTAPPIEKARIFFSKHFQQYVLNRTGIDLMSGILLRSDKVEYLDPFDTLGADGCAEMMGERIPLGALEDWYILYSLMAGREARVLAIEEHWMRGGTLNRKRLKAIADDNLPADVREKVARLLHSKE